MGRENIGNTPFLKYPIDGTDFDSAPVTKAPATALQHAYIKETNFGLKTTDTPVAGTYFLHQANGVETIQSIKFGCFDTGSSASITFDLQKNGVSILTGVITVANTDPDLTPKSGTISAPTLANNDILTIVIAVSSSTGMQGPYASCAIIAAASPN